MKKVFISFFVLWFVLLAGCSNTVNKGEPAVPSNSSFSVKENFYSDEKNHYSLLVIKGENMKEIDWFEWQEKNSIRNVNVISFQKLSLQQANERFKFLELEELPAYLAFDTKDIAFQTNNEEELIEFLQDNVPESWNY